MNVLPQHVAIIMDGNGRWAEAHELPRIAGHKRGMEVSENIVDASIEHGIRYLTLYAFSEENWNRPSLEVDALMQLLRAYLHQKRSEMMEKGIRFMTVGDIERLPAEVQKEITETTTATAEGKVLTLIAALSYGSRQEICRAVDRLIASGIKRVTPDDLTKALDTHEIPDPDLLIRTSGEYRISNFLLWQLAYTELYFTETLWPDFNEKEYEQALYSFAKRERRFGLTSSQLRGMSA